MGSPKKRYDFWFGVRVSVEAATSEEAENCAAEWLQAAVKDAETQVGVAVTEPPFDLAEVAVRLLNQIGEERRARQAEGSQEGDPSPR